MLKIFAIQKSSDIMITIMEHKHSYTTNWSPMKPSMCGLDLIRPTLGIGGSVFI
jgi:hypothetical protein